MKFERYLTHQDVAVLGRYAEACMRAPDHGEMGLKLVEVLSGARILPVGAHEPDYVSLNARIVCSSVRRNARYALTLVDPFEANSDKSLVSVLSPVGLALIGQRVDCICKVALPSGLFDFMKILEVASGLHAIPDHGYAIKRYH